MPRAATRAVRDVWDYTEGGGVQILKRMLNWGREGERSPIVVPPKVHGYQIVYDQATRSMVDPDFEPLVNEHSARPDWFEYWPIRCFFAEAEVDEAALYGFLSPKCPVSCDHIPRRSWALFRARDVMRGVIESFKAEQAA